MAVTPWSMVSLSIIWLGACAAMFTDRPSAPKSLMKRVIGIIAMSSWLPPKEEPFAAKTPITM